MTVSDGPACDRCGRTDNARYRFCPECQLFVCSRCWDSDPAVCLTCSRPKLPVPGQMPTSIRSTIGTRSPGVPASASRLGRALAGPTGDVQTQAGQAGRAPRPSPQRGLAGRGVLVAVGSGVLVIVVLLAVPVLSRLLVDDPRAPSASAIPTQAVKGARSTPVASPAAPRRYVVRRGDTLRSISSAVYGDEGRWRDIYRANRRTLRDPDVLKVGTTLVIP